MTRLGCNAQQIPHLSETTARAGFCNQAPMECVVENEMPKYRLFDGDQGSDDAPQSICPINALAVASARQSRAQMSVIISDVPHSPRWARGRRDRPWGLGDDYVPHTNRRVSDLETVLVGKKSWVYRADGQRTYETLREAFVGERLNGAGLNCGCVSSYAFGIATVDCDAQLEFLREVMKRVLLQMPDLDLDAMSHDLFAGQRHFCEHYLWWLENEAFVAHPAGQERQDRLLLTDEGCAVLAMLEMTKPGSNVQLSPEAMHRMRQREGRQIDADRPRFLHDANDHLAAAGIGPPRMPTPF